MIPIREFVFTSFKLSLIYLAFMLLVVLSFLYYFDRFSLPKIRLQNKLSYPVSFFTNKSLLFSFITLFLIPSGFDYYISNLFIFNPKIDSSLFFVGKSLLLIIVLLVLTKLFINLSVLHNFNTTNAELNNIFTQISTFKDNYLLYLKSFNQNLMKIKIRIILKNIIKYAVLISFFFPLVMLSISGLVKITLFSIFQITTQASLSFNEHILYSLFVIKTSIGFASGTNGIVFLRNINGDYFFLPTSYYSDPFDWIYGLLGSIIWFITVIYLFKVIQTILSDKKRAFQKFKTITFYLLLLLIWNLFSFGLFQPSSFLLRKKLNTQQNQNFFNNLSIVNVQIFFLPFGFLLILACLLYYLLISVISKKRFNDKKIVQSDFKEEII